MSLTLYFYKVKKGKTPNALNKTYWACYRRMYWTYDYLERHQRQTKDKNGYTVFKIEPEDMPKILDIRESLRHGDWFYDDECERRGLNWLAKRTMDFEKYDFYVLNA